MNGTRTNQFDAPTSFMTSISRRRANVASRIVLTIRNSDDTRSTTERPKKISRAVLVASRSPRSACSGVATLSTPGWDWNCRWIALVSSARFGTIRNDVGKASDVTLRVRSGSLAKIRLNSASAAFLSM